MGSIATQVSIIEDVSDMVYVDILNTKHRYASYEYAVSKGDKKVVRKGNFSAPSVQLRTNNFNVGTYHFQLMLDGDICQTISFSKRKEVFAFA